MPHALKNHLPNRVRVTDPGPITQVRFVIPNLQKRKRLEAYKVLESAAVLQMYIRKFKYHDSRQTACMKASFTIEAPFIICKRIESELAPLWQRGKFND